MHIQIPELFPPTAVKIFWQESLNCVTMRKQRDTRCPEDGVFTSLRLAVPKNNNNMFIFDPKQVHESVEWRPVNPDL